MITVTPRAAEQIGRQVREAGHPGLGLRVAARRGEQGSIEYGMGFDDPAEDDVKVAAGDIVLLVSPACEQLLSGATLDYVELNPGEMRFIFLNPNDPAHKPPAPAP